MSGVEKAFFPKPRVLYVDEDHSVKPPAYETITDLIKSLHENGPLVASGQVGPSAYTTPATVKKKVDDQEMYGWKAGTFKESKEVSVILLGAEHTETQDYVYFILAQDITRDENSLIRGYQPAQDTHVYFMTYKNFLERSLVDLHPICPHAEWLFSTNVNALLDRGETEQKCREIGQKIFDHYKSQAQGNSGAGRSAVVRICNAAKVLTRDGAMRKAHIAYVWDGIGDKNWKWQR